MQNNLSSPRNSPSEFSGIISPASKIGEVPEWLNGTVSKTVVGSGPPRVRIPPSPQTARLSQVGLLF